MPFLRCALLLLSLAWLPRASAHSNWLPDARVPTRENLWSIASSGSALLAVGEHGTMIYFDYAEGEWADVKSGVSMWLVGVGHGANRWIVVGDGGTILVSDDEGVTWQSRTSGTSNRLNAVAYGGGHWLAVGEGGTVVSSADGGNTWTARNVAQTGFLRALAFGQGRFLFGGAGGALFTTVDGTTLERVAITTTADIEAAAISGARFFISGSNGLVGSAPSPTGPWQLSSTGSYNTLRGLAARSDTDVSATADRTAYAYSGAGWPSVGLAPRFLTTAMTVGRDEAVVVGFGGGVARSSSLYALSVVPEPGRLVPYGSTIRIRAVPAGAASNLQYQWSRNRVAIPGATSDELVMQAGESTGGEYGVTATAASGIPLSSLTAITVVHGGQPDVTDNRFAPTLPAHPSAMAFLPEEKMLVYGAYTGVAGSTRSIWLRLHADGSVDSSFQLDPSVSGMVLRPLPDGRFYGNTSIPGGQRVVRLLADGAIDPTFTADSSLASAALQHALPDGRVYVRSPRGFERLLADGTIDPSFTAIAEPGIGLFAVDDFGRLVFTRSEPRPIILWIYPSSLHRYRADGTRDAGFPRYFTNTDPLVLAGPYLYIANRSYGRGGASSTFSRIGLDGGSGSYSGPPGTSYPDYASYMQCYQRDGGIWDFRGDGGGYWQGRFYSPNGGYDPTRWLKLPLSDRIPRLIAVGPDNAIYVATNLNSLHRIRPLVGQFGRLVNLSVRAVVSSAERPLVAGFVTAGNGETRAVLRAVGPGLQPYGVTDAMPDPLLTLVVDGATRATNDQWPDELADRFPALGAFPLASGSRDAALETIVGPGAHSAVVAPAPGTSGGSALVELYEVPATTPPRRFINLSARGPVGPGRPLIAGFGIAGEIPVRLLLRAAGPALRAFGVTDALPNPRLILRQGDTILYENEDWSNSTATGIGAASSGTGAFHFTHGSGDSAMLVTLGRGSYTIAIEGAGDSSGTALVEVYQLP